MRLNVQEKPLIGIIGLPRSGTTIVSNILDSMDNGFCAVEPIWATTNSDIQTFSTKRGNISTRPIPEIIPRLKELDGDFGALKETYRTHQKDSADKLMAGSTHVIGVLREPCSLFASWQLRKWGSPYNNVHFFINNYQSFIDDLKNLSATKPVTILQYEKLCIDPQVEMRIVFGNAWEGMELKPVISHVGYGDGEAIASTVIKSAPVRMPQSYAARKIKQAFVDIQAKLPSIRTLFCLFLSFAICCRVLHKRHHPTNLWPAAFVQHGASSVSADHHGLRGKRKREEDYSEARSFA